MSPLKWPAICRLGGTSSCSFSCKHFLARSFCHFSLTHAPPLGFFHPSLVNTFPRTSRPPAVHLSRALSGAFARPVLMRIPRQRIKIALRLWMPVLMLRIVVALQTDRSTVCVNLALSQASTTLSLSLSLCYQAYSKCPSIVLKAWS